MKILYIYCLPHISVYFYCKEDIPAATRILVNVRMIYLSYIIIGIETFCFLNSTFGHMREVQILVSFSGVEYGYRELSLDSGLLGHLQVLAYPILH